MRAPGVELVPSLLEPVISARARHSPWALVAVAFAIGVVSALAMALTAPKLTGSHWTETARALAPTRAGFTWIRAILPLLLSAIVFAALDPPFIPRAPLALAVAVTSAMGVDLVANGFAARHSSAPLRGRLTTYFRDRAFEAIPLAIVACAYAAMGGRFGARGVLVICVAAIALMANGAAVSWWLLRFIGEIRPASARLEASVREAARRVGVNVRSVSLLRSHGLENVNALALPSLETVAFTEDALEILDEREIFAVALHEVGHLAEPRALRSLRFFSTLELLPYAALGAVAEVGDWFGAMFLAAMCQLAIRHASRALSLALEHRADAMVRAHAADGEVYARALEKAAERNGTPLVTGTTDATHPDTWDRMRAAGFVPRYPKPASPGNHSVVLALAVSVCGGALAVLMSASAAFRPARHELSGWALARADERTQVRDLDEACRLHAIAADLGDRDNPVANLCAVLALARAHACNEARWHRAEVVGVVDAHLLPLATAVLELVDSCR